MVEVAVPTMVAVEDKAPPTMPVRRLCVPLPEREIKGFPNFGSLSTIKKEVKRT